MHNDITTHRRTRMGVTVIVLTAAVLGAGAFAIAAAAPAPAPASAGSDATAPDGHGADDGEIPADAPLEATSSAAALAGLERGLREAVQAAAAAAEADGITLRVTSGWRSSAYQERLFEQAVRDYASREAASQWVAEPRRSAHVQGLAVDVGPTDAYSWLDGHGAQFGLCRIFANEGWHFEMREGAETDGCPAMLESAAADTRRW